MDGLAGELEVEYESAVRVGVLFPGDIFSSAHPVNRSKIPAKKRSLYLADIFKLQLPTRACF